MAKFNATTSIRVAGLGLALVLLGACSSGGVGDILGLEKRTPDEFNVVSRAPLTLPPNYGLRPPDPNSQRNQDLRPRESAQEALFGRNATQRLQKQKEMLRDEGASPGEIALLEMTGAFEADPAIREIVEEETAALAREQDSFVDDLVFWKDKPQAGDIVDPGEEQRRLQENSALGRAPTEGDTPLIRRESEEPLLEWPF